MVLNMPNCSSNFVRIISNVNLILIHPSAVYWGRGALHGDVRTKPLLVVLDSDHSAKELIKKSHVLRGHDEVKDACVNRDLTPAEALAAYDQRCRRRAARARCGTTTTTATRTATTRNVGECPT